MVGFDEAYETVPGHQQVDALLCFGEGGFVWPRHALLNILGSLVVNIHLKKERERGGGGGERS